MGGHNALYGGPRVLVGCSLSGYRRAPAPLRRASVSGGAPPCAPSPPLLLPSRRLVAPPPVPPSDLMSSCLLLCSVRTLVVCPSCVRGRWRCSGPLGRPPSSALSRRCRMPPDVPRSPPPSCDCLRSGSGCARRAPLGLATLAPL